MKRLLRFTAAVMLALACATAAAAGTTGAISGRVVDHDGHPLADAAVTVVAPSGRFEATSDARGHYQILSIFPDRYHVSVFRRGKMRWRAVPVEIHADKVTTCNVRMDPALQIIGAPSPVGNAVVPCSFITAVR